MSYQRVTGTLSPGAHAGSYNGQDAYNDMLVIESDIQHIKTRLSYKSNNRGGICVGGNGLFRPTNDNPNWGRV